MQVLNNQGNCTFAGKATINGEQKSTNRYQDRLLINFVDSLSSKLDIKHYRGVSKDGDTIELKGTARCDMEDTLKAMYHTALADDQVMLKEADPDLKTGDQFKLTVNDNKVNLDFGNRFAWEADVKKNWKSTIKDIKANIETGAQKVKDRIEELETQIRTSKVAKAMLERIKIDLD